MSILPPSRPVRQPRSTVIARALRLRCPNCGGDRLFRGMFRMNERCACCGLKYEREPGYFLGSIYINYGLTAVLVTLGYLYILLATDFDRQLSLIPLLIFCILFPAWFFRYARALWIAFDIAWDPPAETPKPSSRPDASTGATRTSPTNEAAP